MKFGRRPERPEDHHEGERVVVLAQLPTRFEADELAEDALVREIEEEVSVAITRPADPPMATLENGDLRLRIWLVGEWSGEPENVQLDEHDEIVWFSLAEVRQLRLADSSYVDIIERALRSD